MLVQRLLYIIEPQLGKGNLVFKQQINKTLDQAISLLANKKGANAPFV